MDSIDSFCSKNSFEFGDSLGFGFSDFGFLFRFAWMFRIGWFLLCYEISIDDLDVLVASRSCLQTLDSSPEFEGGC